MMALLQLIRGAITWSGGASIDGDGSPNCYSPNGDGLDYLANAGHDGDWWGIVTDDGKTTGNPVVGANGKYLSPTSLVDHSKTLTDPDRYVNSERIPYCTLTKDMRAMGATFGDVAMVCYRGVNVAVICADYGPHPGEISIAAAVALSIPSSPKDGGVSGGVTFVVFAGSAKQPAWPRTVDDINAQASVLFEAWGGANALVA